MGFCFRVMNGQLGHMTVKDNDVLKSELKTCSVNGQTELLVGEPLEEKNILEKFDNRVEPPFGLKCEHFSNMTRLVNKGNNKITELRTIYDTLRISPYNLPLYFTVYQNIFLDHSH